MLHISSQVSSYLHHLLFLFFLYGFFKGIGLMSKPVVRLGTLRPLSLISNIVAKTEGSYLVPRLPARPIRKPSPPKKLRPPKPGKRNSGILILGGRGILPNSNLR